MVSIFKSSFFHLSVTVINRFQGVIIIALMYRLFSLDQIGDYFFILSYHALFSSIVLFGSGKVLVKEYLIGDYDSSNRIINTRLYLAIPLACILFSIAYFCTRGSFDYILYMVFSFTLITYALLFDWILVAKKKFYLKGIFQVFSQAMVLFVFGSSLLGLFGASIELHQIIPSLVLFLVIAIATRVDKKKILKNRKIVSSRYFKENKFLIFSSLLLAVINVVDISLGKSILSDEDLGVFAGLLRLAFFNVSLMTSLNTVFFSFCYKSDGKYELQRKKIVKIVNSVCLVATAFISYPYVYYIMDIKDIDFNLVASCFLIFVSVYVMSNFFLSLSKLEENCDKLSTKMIAFEIIKFSPVLVLFAVGSYFLVNEDFYIIVMSAFFSLKWCLLSFVFRRICVRYSIK